MRGRVHVGEADRLRPGRASHGNGKRRNGAGGGGSRPRVVLPGVLRSSPRRPPDGRSATRLAPPPTCLCRALASGGSTGHDPAPQPLPGETLDRG
jgi:hypothetical protein